jgi:hypothetical protein
MISRVSTFFTLLSNTNYSLRIYFLIVRTAPAVHFLNQAHGPNVNKIQPERVHYYNFLHQEYHWLLDSSCSS